MTALESIQTQKEASTASCPEYAINTRAYKKMELLCVLADELFEEFGGTYVEVRATPFSSPSVVEVEIEDLIVKGGRNNSFSRGVENADCVRFKKSGSGAILVAFGVNGVWRTR